MRHFASAFYMFGNSRRCATRRRLASFRSRVVAKTFIDRRIVGSPVIPNIFFSYSPDLLVNSRGDVVPVWVLLGVPPVVVPLGAESVRILELMVVIPRVPTAGPILGVFDNPRWRPVAVSLMLSALRRPVPTRPTVVHIIGVTWEDNHRAAVHAPVGEVIRVMGHVRAAGVIHRGRAGVEIGWE